MALDLWVFVWAPLRSGAGCWMEIITGAERRRCWRLEEKLRIVAEGKQSGASFADIAPRHKVNQGGVARGCMATTPSCRRLWTYVRDDWPFGGPAPSGAVFRYSRDHGGEHPQGHLAGYSGILQADAYGGYGKLYEPSRTPGPILEAACWAHAGCGGWGTRRIAFLMSPVDGFTVLPHFACCRCATLHGGRGREEVGIRHGRTWSASASSAG